MHPPPSSARANFTLMIECTPESSRCYSVYSVYTTSFTMRPTLVIPSPLLPTLRLRLLVIDFLLVSGWAQMVDSWVTGAIRTSWTAGTTRMLAVRTMKRSVKTFLAWRIRTSRIAGMARMLVVRKMKWSVKVFLAWRHKDEQDSGDCTDAGRQDNEEVS